MITRVEFATPLTADAAVLEDGSIWSHAATIGPCWYRGSKIEMTAALFKNFVRVFSSALPKVPVDYDHGQTNGATDGKQPVPAAGQVLELAVVEKTADLTAPMLAQLAKSGRQADHASAMGLWIRWRPTPTALRMVKDREYTELSIAFGKFDNPRTGKNEGEALVAVALCNRPHLTDMLSVAASAQDGGSPTVSGHEDQPMNKLLTSLTAWLGKPVTTEEEGDRGIQELRAQNLQLAARSGQLDAITAEIGETDPLKAIAKVRELKAAAVTALSQAEVARKTEVATKVASELTRLEKKYLPAQKPLLEAQLTAEFTAGATSTTVKLLEGMPDLPVTGRKSGADNGANATLGARLDTRITELRNADKDLSYSDALERAEREIADTARATTTSASA